MSVLCVVGSVKLLLRTNVKMFLEFDFKWGIDFLLSNPNTPVSFFLTQSTSSSLAVGSSNETESGMTGHLWRTLSPAVRQWHLGDISEFPSLPYSFPLSLFYPRVSA